MAAAGPKQRRESERQRERGCSTSEWSLRSRWRIHCAKRKTNQRMKEREPPAPVDFYYRWMSLSWEEKVHMERARLPRNNSQSGEEFFFRRVRRANRVKRGSELERRTRKQGKELGKRPKKGKQMDLRQIKSVGEFLWLAERWKTRLDSQPPRKVPLAIPLSLLGAPRHRDIRLLVGKTCLRLIMACFEPYQLFSTIITRLLISRSSFIVAGAGATRQQP